VRDRSVPGGGSRRVFACAWDWPGWCRSGREDAALSALKAAAPRYAVVCAAGAAFDPAAARLDITERVAGTATTDFGALDVPPGLDGEPLSGSDARRQAALVEAAWAVFDQVADFPGELRKGPRGGAGTGPRSWSMSCRPRSCMRACSGCGSSRFRPVTGRRPTGSRPHPDGAAGRRRGPRPIGSRPRAAARALRRPPCRLARAGPRLGDPEPAATGMTGVHRHPHPARVWFAAAASGVTLARR
jgi:hypothetical protein